MNPKPTRRGLERFTYFARCADVGRLPAVVFVEDGYSAAECFHMHETSGEWLPCREPMLLARALNGKERHGVTVMDCAQDYLGRLLFASELRANYPPWVQAEILRLAAKLAKGQMGYVPTFVATGDDFTTLAGPVRAVGECAVSRVVPERRSWWLGVVRRFEWWWWLRMGHNPWLRVLKKVECDD